MADWQRRLDLKDVWDTGDIILIAKTIADRLENLDPFGEDDLDEEKDELVEDFKELANDQNASKQDFGYIMEALYDWADTPIGPRVWNGKKACWVATF